MECSKCCVALLLLLGFCRVDGIPLARFYTFGRTAGDASLRPNDDGSSPAISLNVSFPFFDMLHSTVYVNNNGDISFTRAVSTYTPQAFPLSGNLQLIAPYWADVDTRGTGSVWYRQTTDNQLLARARDEIRAAFINQATFNPTSLFIATWDHVGYYNQRTDKTNTFQCVMATNGINSFVIFLYADGEIQWTTGSASGGTNGLGGTPAQVGFNAGDGIRFASVPGSQTAAIINITTTSNVGIPGVWIYRVDEESIAMGGCSSETNAPLTLAPRLGNMLGGTAVLVSGPCLQETDEITCMFGERSVTGLYISEMLLLCVSPTISTTGRVRFQLIVQTNGTSTDRYRGESVFYSVSFDRAHAVDFDPLSLLLRPSTTLTVTWDPQMLLPLQDPASYRVDIGLYRLNLNTGEGVELSSLASNVENSGRRDVTIPTIFDNLSGGRMQTDAYPVAIHVTVASTAPEFLSKRQTDTTLLRKLIRFGLRINVWTGIAYYIATTLSERYCNEWSRRQPLDNGNSINRRLPPCPCTEDQARSPNSGFQEERLSSYIYDVTIFDDLWRNFFHPGTASCFRQTTFTSQNQRSGQQCCYDNRGAIVTGPPGGGTVDLVAPVDDDSREEHFNEDVLPFLYCCKFTSNCREYYKHRPSDDCSRYCPPVPACVYGDPHIVTLDGLKYTFNGKGEFTLIETVDNSFTLQGRMQEATDPNGNLVPATVFTAIVGKQADSDTVQLELSRRGVDTLVNGERVEFGDLPEQDFNNVTVADRGNNTLSATFSSGVHLEVTEENQILSVLIVSLPNSFQGTTLGLMGPFNGNTSDDLLPRASVGQSNPQPLPLNSNLQQIHQLFGITWIIDSAEDSLFTYAPGESWASFYTPQFMPTFTTTFSDPQLQARANEICGDDQFCLYDIAATRRTEIGLSTLIGNQEFEEIVRISAPIVCNPPCENGACVANDTCSCSAGYEGVRCNETVFEECEENPCQNGGTCTMFAGDIICQCPEGLNTIGSFCRTSTGITDCNCSRNIECSIAGQFSAPDMFQELPSGDSVLYPSSGAGPAAEVNLTGKELKCVVAFDGDNLDLNSVKIDNTFLEGTQFLSAGSLSFLSNLGIIPRDEGFGRCEVQQTLSLSSNPAEVLGSVGIERLDVVHLRANGSFGSLQFGAQELQQIALEGGVVSSAGESSCSLQHLFYWLTTGPTINGAVCRQPQGPSNDATVITFTIRC